MKNQIAIVCPSAHLESYVRSTFMKEPYITTALGTTFHTNNKDTVGLLIESIELNDVDQVSFVCDLNAHMIREFLAGHSTGVVTVDRFYQFVFDQYEDEIMETDSAYKQRFSFTEFLIKEQVRELCTTLSQTGNPVIENLQIDGYIVDRSADMKWSIISPEYSTVK
tara:strand:- start:87214 stop:87711 length:498 start_codon:yes stop_codon:yes gene_type:complete